MSCHSAYLGSDKHKALDGSCNASLHQITPSTQPIIEYINKFINLFKKEATTYLGKYIELNLDKHKKEQEKGCLPKHIKRNIDKHKEDLVVQNKAIRHQLCHLFSRDHDLVHLMQSQCSRLGPDTYIAFRNKLFLTVYPDHMARHSFPEQYVKDNFPLTYSNGPLSTDAELREQLTHLLFKHLKEQIIDSINDLFTNQLERNAEWEVHHKNIVNKSKKYIEKIINTRFRNHTKCLKKNLKLLKDSMVKTNLVARNVRPSAKF